MIKKAVVWIHNVHVHVPAYLVLTVFIQCKKPLGQNETTHYKDVWTIKQVNKLSRGDRQAWMYML